MTTASTTQTRSFPRWIHIVVLITGAYYVAVGLSMLAAPRWFFENIGPFPPFNRHYMGDLATFILPMGAGLLMASRDLIQHRLVLWIIGAANILHGLNHVYDAVIGQESLTYWLADTVPLLVGAGLFLVAIWPRPS